ncbi:MAG: CapA family protein [Atopobiaceae bacterium]|nr:CapA family protein [Atopobiaceae bacterium]
MNDAQNGGNYSRELGVAGYRKRRRRTVVTRIIVATVLIAIIGGASYAFGKQFIDPDKVPFDLPGVERNAQEGASEDAEPAAPTTVQPASISLIAAGDVVMDGSVTESGRQESGAYDFGHLFGPLADEIGRFDLRMVSQEAALAGSKFGFGAEYPLNAPQDLGRAEREAGFNVVLRASDHSMDTGAEGIHSELVWWHDTFSDMPVLGIADAEPENNPTLSNYVSNVYVYEKDGFKVAVLNHAVNVPDEGQGMVSRLSEEKIASDVAKAREMGAEMIVACPHWGEEYNPNVVEEQTRYAWAYANQGVDVIIGTHPRVLQRTEVLQREDGHKTVCFYSLGCLTSSLTDNSLLGGLAEVQLDRNDQGVCEVTSAVLKPVITHRGNGTDYRTYLFADYSNDLVWNSWDGWPDVDEWNRRCQDILGEGYDPGAREFRVNLEGATLPPAAEEPEQEEPEQEEPESTEEEQQNEDEGNDEGTYEDYGEYYGGWDY